MNDYHFREYLPQRDHAVRPESAPKDSELEGDNCITINGYMIDANVLLEEEQPARKRLNADHRKAWRLALAAIRR